MEFVRPGAFTLPDAACLSAHEATAAPDRCRMRMEPACALALEASFDSVQAWADDLAAALQGAAADTGWVVLTFLPEGRLAHRCLPAGGDPSAMEGAPLLALEVGAEGGVAATGSRDEFDAWAQRIDWKLVYARYRAAVDGASQGFGQTQAALGTPTLFDVRRAGVYEKAQDRIAGAQWRDPAHVRRWAKELPPNQPVLVYCVYGHEVGRATALQLRAAGLDARYLEGGIDAWRSAGLALEAK